MKKIVIIGASGGIGREVTKHFLDLDWEIIGTCHQNKIEEEILQHKNFTGMTFDITNDDDHARLTKECSEIDAVMVCSGIVEFEAYNDYVHNMDIWNRTNAINLTGPYKLFNNLKSKIEKGGSFILISSTDAKFGGKVNTAYAVSKAGIDSITKSLALWFSETGIRVNCIAPGWVETAMMSQSGDELVAYAKSINPMDRNGSPKDVAHLAEFLISEKSQYINGQTITLDGGYTLQDPTLVFEEKVLKQKK